MIHYFIYAFAAMYLIGVGVLLAAFLQLRNEDPVIRNFPLWLAIAFAAAWPLIICFWVAEDAYSKWRKR